MPTYEVDVTQGGPLTHVFVGAPAAYQDEAGPDVAGMALVDTGAWMSAISPAVVASLKPPRLGAEAVARSVGVVDIYPTYLIRIRMGEPGSRWLDVEAIGIEPASPDVDIIIGRDLLRKMAFFYDGPHLEAWLEY